MLPVYKPCPAVVDGGIGGGSYVNRDIFVVGSGNERNGGEEKSEEETGYHCKMIKNEKSESSWFGIVGMRRMNGESKCWWESYFILSFCSPQPCSFNLRVTHTSGFIVVYCMFPWHEDLWQSAHHFWYPPI